jgi:ketosteroid isomerase-like protein
MTSRTCCRLVAIAVGCLTIACAQPPRTGSPDTSASQAARERDHAAVERIRLDFETGENTDSLDLMTRHFATDVVGMPPGRATTVGPDALREALRGFLAAFKVEVRYTSDEIVIAGDWAFDRGSAVETLRPKAGGASTTENAKYLWLSQRVNGTWKLARLIWNADPPPAPPSTSR